LGFLLKIVTCPCASHQAYAESLPDFQTREFVGGRCSTPQFHNLGELQMQKKIIALAIAAAFAAPVAAQAEVTMYGSMDGGVRHQTNDAASQGTTDTMQMGQYNTARFGFKGVDDLGGGMKATVVLETSLAPGGVGSNPNTNTSASTTNQTTFNTSNPFGLLFDRQATIGVAGGWGSFDMGWNYTASFKTIKNYDPFDYKFLAIAGAKSSDYADRAGSMAYGGKFGDVSVIAEYYVNNGDKTQDVGPTSAPGKGRAVALNYDSNGINVGFAYTVIEAGLVYTTSGAAPSTPTVPVVISAAPNDGITHMTAGAGYNFGDGKVSFGYAKKATKAFGGVGNDATDTNMWLGASFNMSTKVSVTAAYYSNAKNSGAANANDSTKKTMMAGVTYSLSKATQVYFELDRATSNSGAANAADTVVSGTSAGLNTSF
jgi:predicted porin